jgi:DNA-binding transcriptional ArsR family regulator
MLIQLWHIFNHMVEYDFEQKLDYVFHALADRTRRSLLEKIKRKPVRVTELAGEFPISLNAISKHLKVLEKAGLIKRNIEGRVHLCQANPEQLQSAGKWIKKYTNFWNEKLDNLEKYVSKKRR